MKIKSRFSRFNDNNLENGFYFRFSFVQKKNEPKRKLPAHAFFTLVKIKICQQRSKLAWLKQ
jgi:hypothetical protein